MDSSLPEYGSQPWSYCLGNSEHFIRNERTYKNISVNLLNKLGSDTGEGGAARTVKRTDQTLIFCENSDNYQQIDEGWRALVVEDNVDAAQMLGMFLELQGFQVRLLHEGSEVSQVAEEWQPAVIFLDIGLPGKDGYEVAKEIRQKQLLSRSTLVALTGYGGDSEKELAQQAGFDFHLLKPVDGEELERFLGSLKTK